MTYDFLSEYLFFNSGNECPRDYHIWSALVCLAAATHKKTHIHWGYFDIYPNLFVCLVGKQGSRKSTAKDITSDLFTQTFPDYPIGASVQSREDIIKYMSSDAGLVSYKDPEGTIIEVRPIVFFINELKNFLSVDPGKMIEFLTDIYDRKQFKSSTIKRGLEDLKNPCVNILACEVPSWITDKLKSGIVSGGFARRVVYVYVTERGPRISFPIQPSGAAEMWLRFQNHLRKVAEVVGTFQWTPEAMLYWDRWYQNLKFPEDEVMAGYYESKHIQVLKIAMLLALSRFPIILQLTVALLEQAIAMADVLEVNMPKLSQAAGRNELAIPMQQTIELLEKAGGWMPDKALRKLLDKHLSPMEQVQVLKHLQDTEQIYVRSVIEPTQVKRLMTMTKERYASEKEKGNIK